MDPDHAAMLEKGAEIGRRRQASLMRRQSKHAVKAKWQFLLVTTYHIRMTYTVYKSYAHHKHIVHSLCTVLRSAWFSRASTFGEWKYRHAGGPSPLGDFRLLFPSNLVGMPKFSYISWTWRLGY